MSTLSLDARLLRELRATAVHLLPGDFADALGVPREQIADALTRLRGAGFDIEENKTTAIIKQAKLMLQMGIIKDD